MRKSLFKKYFSLTSAVIVISFIFLGVLLISLVGNYAVREKKNLLTSTINDISNVCSQSISEFGGVNTNLIKYQILTLSRAIDSDIFITDPFGNIQIKTDSDYIHNKNQVPPNVAELAISKGYSNSSDLGGLYKKKNFVVGVPIKTRDGTVFGIVFAATSTDGISEYAMDVFKIFLSSAAAVLSLSFIIIYGMTYRLVRPLHIMSAASKRMGEGDFSIKVPVDGDDEIGALAIAFNNMSASLSSLESMRRSFIANVSHELKTPMTTIAGFIDGILDGTIPPAKQNQYLQTVSDEIRRLSRMVTSMLNLSKFEAGELKVKPVEFDLSDAVCRIFLSLERMIEEKQLEVRGLEKLEPQTVFADRDLITQVVYNLVDNAIKFSSKNGSIEIGLKSSDNKVFVSIKNSGMGIAAQDLPHVFERFYKSDKSRGIDKSGAGLGLYIVKTIIDLHKGQILVKSLEGEYCEFIFWIPNNTN